MPQSIPKRDREGRQEYSFSFSMNSEGKHSDSIILREYFLELAYRIGSALSSVLISVLVALIYGVITGWNFNTTFIIIEVSVVFGIILFSEQLSYSVFVHIGKEESFAKRKIVDLDEIISKRIISERDTALQLHDAEQLDIQAIHLKISSPSFAREMLQRLTALVMIFLVLPVLLISGLLVGLTSRGPVIVRIRCVGLRGKIFKLMRLRTSFLADESTTRHDFNNTTVGRFLNKTRIANIPALLNVISGDMNIIGPRPYSVADYYRAKEEIEEWDLRNMVKPGLTGLAQVERGYIHTIGGLKSELFYDLHYISDLSVLQDVKILLKTVYVMITGKGEV